jgi:hypothetical protein
MYTHVIHQNKSKIIFYQKMSINKYTCLNEKEELVQSYTSSLSKEVCVESMNQFHKNGCLNWFKFTRSLACMSCQSYIIAKVWKEKHVIVLFRVFSTNSYHILFHPTHKFLSHYQPNQQIFIYKWIYLISGHQ